MYKTKILIQRSMALGDVIMTTPIIRSLYDQYEGNCEIDIRTIYADVYVNNPYINKIIGMRDNLNVADYDHFINLDLAYEKNLKTHVIEAYKRLALGHKYDIEDSSTEIHYTDEDEQFVDQYMTDNKLTKGKFAVVHIHQGGWPAKNLPTDFWSDIVENILDNSEHSVVQIGLPNEMAFDGDDRLINALGKFSIPQLALLIDRAKLYIGVDSGPTHIAGATETTIVGFYTAARSDYLKPLRTKGTFVPIAADIECYGCRENILPPDIDFKCVRGDVDCINRFDIDKVNATINNLL